MNRWEVKIEQEEGKNEYKYFRNEVKAYFDSADEAIEFGKTAISACENATVTIAYEEKNFEEEKEAPEDMKEDK